MVSGDQFRGYFNSRERDTEYMDDSGAGKRYLGGKINNFSLRDVRLSQSQGKFLSFRLSHAAKSEKEEEIWGLAYASVRVQTR